MTNKLYFSQLVGPTSPPGFLPQLVVDLNVEPPHLGELLSDPPIYAPNGGTINNGLYVSLPRLEVLVLTTFKGYTGEYREVIEVLGELSPVQESQRWIQ